MSVARQIYYNAVFGAIGGLIGWLLVGLVATGDWNIFLAYAFVGAGVGLCIGLATGIVNGVIIQPSLTRALTGAALGGGAGIVSGALGLLIGEGGFLVLQGGIIGRTLGWMMLGLFLGVGEGLLSVKLIRASYGAVGGALAGLVGGLIYETLTQLFITQGETVQSVAAALGLVLIGACLGGIIPITVEFLGKLAGKGTLQVLSGKRKDLTVSVIDSVTLGSSDSCDVYLPGDRGIDKQHAIVFQSKGGYFIRDLGSRTGTQVTNQPVTTQPPGRALRCGDQIRLGETVVLFK